jgi:hypothetical protein
MGISANNLVIKYLCNFKLVWTLTYSRVHLKNIKVLITSLVLFTSCNEKSDEFKNLPGIDFGDSNYYDSFLFVESQNPPVSKTLEFYFNNWAKTNKAFVEFALTDRSGNILGSAQSGVNVYINDRITKNGRFKINSSKTGSDTLNIKLLFNPSKNSQDFTGFLTLLNGNIDRINNTESNGERAYLFKWNAQQTVNMNPLKKSIIWVLIVLTGLLLIWFLIIRNLVYPKMGNGQLILNTPYYKTIKTKGKREIIFTNKAKNQQFLEKIFAGKIYHEQNPIWDGELRFSSSGKNQIRLKLPSGYLIEPYTSKIKRGSTYTIFKDQEQYKISYL